MKNCYFFRKCCTDCNPASWFLRFGQRHDIWRPLLIMLLLAFSQPFCGLLAMSYYAVTLLSSTNLGLDKVNTCMS